MFKLKKIFKRSLAFTLVASIFLLSSCQQVPTAKPIVPPTKTEVYKIEFLDLFDTFIQLLGTEMEKSEFEKLGEEIHQELKRMHQLFDIFNPYPDVTNLYQVNQQAGKGPIAIDPLLFELLEFSLKMHDLTNGKTNIAMGAVLNLWHQARIFSNENPANAYIPKEEELTHAAQHTDIKNIRLDKEKMTVEILDPELSIDTGAIAKGFAAEKIAQRLEANGMQHLLLNFGGNVRTIGDKTSSGQQWKVAIQNPDLQSDQPYLYMLNIRSKSTVTSGIYERYFTYQGHKYHHIIDNTTNFPGTRYTGVSIITQNSGLADALSTAIFLLPEDEGRKIAKQIGDVEILWVYPNGKQSYTDGFLTYQAPPKSTP